MRRFANCLVLFTTVQRHDEVTDFLAACMKELHTDVELEPMLQPLTGESFSHRTANTEPDARADIRVRGFWTQSQNTFLIQGYFIPTHQATGPDFSLRSITSWRRQRKVSMKKEYSRSGARELHTNGVFSLWWHEHESYSGYQEDRRCPCHQAWRELQEGGDLDEMPSGLFIGKVCHYMYPGFPLHTPQIATCTTSGLGVSGDSDGSLEEIYYW